MRRIACYALAAVVLLALAVGLAEARRPHNEAYYQEAWCSARGGEAEVILQDQTRCDCLTASHAVEVDFAKKWAEGIGQSLHYSRLTGRRAGLLLIVERPADWRYVHRVDALRRWLQLPLDVYTMEAEQ